MAEITISNDNLIKLFNNVKKYKNTKKFSKIIADIFNYIQNCQIFDFEYLNNIFDNYNNIVNKVSNNKKNIIRDDNDLYIDELQKEYYSSDSDI